MRLKTENSSGFYGENDLRGNIRGSRGHRICPGERGWRLQRGPPLSF